MVSNRDMVATYANSFERVWADAQPVDQMSV